MKKILSALFNLGLTVALLLSFFTTLLAASPSPPEVVAAEPLPLSTAQAVERLEIRLQRATFDPLYEMADVPLDLSLSAYPGDGTGHYLVQFHGPILTEWRDGLEKEGAVVLDYVPQFAYIVRMDIATAARVQALDAVRWVGLYQPAFRLSTTLDGLVASAGPEETARITLRSFAGEPDEALVKQLEPLGAEVRATGQDTGSGNLFKVELPAASIPAVARLSSVAWVEPWAAPRLHNEITRSSLVFDKDGVEAQLGLYGAGQIVVVGDTGVSTGNESTMHSDFRGHFYKGSWGSGTCGSWEDYYAHGTHVAGSVLGSGVMDGAVTSTHSYSGTNAGIAPEAHLWAWGFCDDWSGLPDTDPYNDYYAVMYDDNPRVRINTNSWGYDTTAGTYDAFSRETDRFIWDHPDMVVLFSASNDGTDGNSDGIVDEDSMGVPSGAKNIITVGASENYRLSGGYNPGGTCSTWGSCWPSDYPYNPVRDDRLSDDPCGMVAFSSRGPVDDGRLKPDIVAPGSNVVSTRHQSGSADPLWGVYNDWYSYCGGTSMATPLAAGASAVVREFYTVTYGIDPTAALVKATLINGAYDMTPGQYRDEVPTGAQDDVIRRPDNHQGWGRIDLLNTLVHEPPYGLWFYEDHTGLNTGQTYTTTFTVSGDDHPFRVTLVWSDYPGTEATHGALVNDLDLKVIAPDSTFFYGNDIIGDGLQDGDVDHVNNVEGIDFNPQLGRYTVVVKGYNVPQGPQPFALVASGDISMGGYLDGTVYDGTLGGELEGASVQAITGTVEYQTTSRASGYYTMPMTMDTYTVNAWKYGYGQETATGIVIISETVTTQNFTLTQTSAYSLTGCVTDFVTSDPLAATVSVLGPFGDPITQTAVLQVTGCYTFSLYGGPYTVMAKARLHESDAVTVNLTANTVQNFALDATTTDGLLWGTITSLQTSNPVEGATIQLTPGLTSTQSAADGYYEMQLPNGTCTVTVSAPLYSTVEEAGVIVPQSNLTEHNYGLPTAHMVLLPPEGLGVSLYMGEQVTETLTVSNAGAGGLEFEISERDGEYTPLAAAPLAGEDVLVIRHDTAAATAIEAALAALGYTYLGVTDAVFWSMTLDELLAYQAVFHAGTTGASSFPGASETLLLAYLDAGGSLFIADNDLGYWRHGYPFYDTYLQANYVSDDPHIDILVGEDMMAGLTLNVYADPYPDDFTVMGEGTRIFQFQGGNAAGVAIDRNDYRAIYISTDFDDIASPANRQEVVSRAMDFLPKADVPWLAHSPISGTVAAGNVLPVMVSFDASEADQPGDYTAVLRILSNDPEAQPYVDYPVTMTVQSDPTWGKLAGTVTSDRPGGPLEDALVEVISDTTTIYSITTETDGTYAHWLPGSVYTVAVSASGYLADHQVVTVTAGVTTTHDVVLTLEAPGISVMPTVLTLTQDMNEVVTRSLTIYNTGGADLTFTIQEITQVTTLQMHSPQSIEYSGEVTIAPIVLEALAQEGQTNFLVVLAEQSDLRTAYILPTKQARGRFVREALWETAQRSQAPLRAWLDAQGVSYRSFYVVNLIHVLAGDQTLLGELAARPDVAHIEANPRIQNIAPQPAAYPEPSSLQAIEWNIQHVGAPEVWALGYTGQGLVVGGQDTGYDWDHPALINQYRGWNGTTADHDYNWHDAIRSGGGVCGADSPEPCDDGGHGSHTMGTVLGYDGGSNQIGMAPGARWIGCRNMDQGVGTPATYLECFEFFLAPYPVGGNPSQGNPDLAPDVTNNSWICPPSEGCSWDTLQAAVEAQRAAGIMTVVAASNGGSSCNSVNDPPAIYEASYSVGATTSSDSIASFSSRGPVTVDGSNRLKPDISAPGVSIRSSVPGGDYQGGWQGTSMASPHVAGAVALVWSAQPSLRNQIDLTEQVLNTTAVPRYSTQCGDTPDTVPNNVYGWGRISALEAVQEALTMADILWVSADPISGTVSPGEAITVVVSFDSTGLDPGVYTGTLRIQSDDPYASTVNVSLTMTVLMPPPALILSKMASHDRVEVGLPVTYTLVLDNDGGDATGVVISDTLPALTQFAWASNSGALVGDDVVWSGLSLEGGDTLTVTCGITVTCVTSGTQIVNDVYQVYASEWATPTFGAPVTVTAVTEGVTADFAFSFPVLLNWPVAFTNLGRNVTAYQWAFGDGAFSFKAQPEHAYGEMGPQTVVLTASNLCNAAVVSHPVMVENYAVTVSPTAEAASTDPGTTVTFSLRVTNTGTLSASFQVTTSGNAWSTQLSTDTLSLDVGQGATAFVWVTVPGDMPGVVQDNALVTVRALSDPRISPASAGAALTTTANTVYGVALGPATASQAASSGETVTYTLWVTNTSNALDTITLSRTTSGWPTDFSWTSLQIAAGGHRRVEVYVTIPTTATLGAQDVATVAATGTGTYDEAMLTTMVTTFRVYLPLLVKD